MTRDVRVTTDRRACAAGLLGMWIAVCTAQEAADETGVAPEAEVVSQPEPGPEAGSAASNDAPVAGSGAPADSQVDADATEAVGADADATETADAAQAMPEIGPLNEIFVPSQDIAADEAVTFPVDF